MLSKSQNRFYNVDLLRFIFALIIIVYHFGHKNLQFIDLIPSIYKYPVCCDFFFIISGFFLFKNIKPHQGTFELLLTKFLRLAPMVWFFLIVYMLLSFFLQYVHFNLSNEILRVLLLNGLGYGPVRGLSVGYWTHWYISVLLWVSVFYFMLYKALDKRYHNIIFFIITVISLSMYLNYSKFQTDGTFQCLLGFINVGVLRGLYGLGIGYFISKLYSKNLIEKSTMLNKLIITGFEGYLISSLTYYFVISPKMPAKTIFAIIVEFSILFYLFIIQKGYLSKFLNNKMFARLGDASYSLYVMHPLVPSIFKNLSKTHYFSQHNTVYILTLVLIAVCLGFLVHYIFEVPLNKYMLKKEQLIK